jgi:malate dehydrogenase (oxaloacetate-decarboxylating)
VLKGADAFIGVSAPNILRPEDMQHMARDPIVFAMANPTPEIMPDVAAPYVP